MIKTNKEKVVMISVQGKIHHPIGGGYRVSHMGEPRILPATGGITYNVKVGDSAFGLEGDHIEPGVSIRNEEKSENDALMTLSCTGNTAKIISGDGKNAIGYVVGGHGGIEHTITQFDEETLDKLAIDDKVLVKAYGQGLKLIDYPEISVMNIDPNLLENIPIVEENGKIKFPVVCEVPAVLMGSGLGSLSAYSGDYDIMTADEETVKKYGIDKIKFGDFVMLRDCDNTFGRGYLNGAVTIGVVIHSDCIKSGHGPGIAVVMTSKKSLIEPIISEDANIKNYINTK